MSTSLFGDIIFGPVHSRRLGLSLGVNLLPVKSKVCDFNCIYCECGWNTRTDKPTLNSREDVKRELEKKLILMGGEGRLPDVITFAGNGEPTLHPQFEQIIDDTLELRDRLAPSAKVSVLSNATMLHRADVRRALLKVDNNILKLDSAFDRTVKIINQPQQAGYTVERIVQNMQSFEGRLIVQTMFLAGEYNGVEIDNTTELEVEAWLQLIGRIAPSRVMIYTIDRDTPAAGLIKIPRQRMQQIAARVQALGIPCSVSA